MTRLYIVEQSGWEPGGHYHAYTGCVAAGARELGLDVVILANKRVRSAITGPLSPDIVPCFTYTWGEAEQHGSLRWEPGNIAFEMFEGFERVPPATDDHVFLHTLGYRELQALLACLTEKVPLLPLPNFHILLRRDPDLLIDNYKNFADYFERLAASPYLQQKIRLYTDTHLLSEAFADVCRVPFLTAPIPFEQDLLRQALAAREPRAAGDPLTVVYLGDAREEKGYQHLPQALSFLWPDYIAKGRVRFVLQSNFNTQGGEPGILAASQILAGFPATTLKSEPLKPAEYYEILAQSDLVVIPYSAQRYRYRSSGVLVEAMGAGKPVVTSAASWMATQVTPDHAVLFETPAGLGPALAEAIDRYAELAKGARAHQDAALRQATGASLVRHLVASAAPPPAATKTRRRVLLVMNGDAMVLENGASRIAHAQMMYLTAAGYNIVGLFLSYRWPASDEAFDRWSAALGRAIASFPLERVFVAGPGRWGFDPDQSPQLRDRRQELGAPLKEEFDFVANFDFGGQALHFLRGHPVDLVLLNYITNYPVITALGLDGVPVVCEMHDLQSFQRAIYGQRLVDAEDLDEEFSWLARCAALLSLNPRETAIVRERMPELPAETTGVFLPAPPAPLPSLAGAKDLAEIVSSSGPVLREYQFEAAWEIGNVASVQRLIEVDTVDLLYISSNHKANVSGLKWFFSEVYEPYLAQHQLSVIVAGSICRHPGWPRDKRIFLIDQVENLAPLYAAARIVILPITEGAGSPVKTYEALAHGRPIVGTSTAFRGIETGSGEFIVRDDPEEFAEAILDLMNSPAERRQAAERSRRGAARYDFAQYFAVMDRVFASALGEARATPTPAPPAASGDGLAIEWSPPLQAMNRAVRSYLDGEPLEGWTLDLLAAERPETVEMLLAGVTGSLLKWRDAAVLHTERRLHRYLTLEPGRLRDSVTSAVSLAIAGRRGVPSGTVETAAPDRVVVHGGLPLTLVGTAGVVTEETAGEGAELSPVLVVDGRAITVRRVADARAYAMGGALFEAKLAPLEGENIGLRLITLNGAGAGKTASGPPLDVAVLRQSISITPGLRLLERDVFQGEFAVQNDSAELKPGQTGRLSLPRMSDGRHAAFVDLCFARTDSASPGAAAATRLSPIVSLRLDGEPAEVEPIRAAMLTIMRIPLAAHGELGDFGVASLEITNRGSQVLRLTAVHSGLLVGPVPTAAAAIATALALRAQRLDPASYLRLAAAARRAVNLIVRGIGPDRAALGTLCDLATEGADEDRLRGLVEQEVARLSQQHNGTNSAAMTLPPTPLVVDDIRAIVGSFLGVAKAGTAILAPDLPFEIVDAAARSLPQETAAALAQRQGSWRVAMPDAARRHAVKVEVDAALEIAEHPGVVESRNFYPAEGPDAGFRWTGPGQTSTITLPLALNMPARLVIELGALGRNTATADFTIACNGSVVPHELVWDRDTAKLTADLPASPQAGLSTEISLTVREVFQQPPDDRSLGVVFCSLSLLLGPHFGAARIDGRPGDALGLASPAETGLIDGMPEPRTGPAEPGPTSDAAADGARSEAPGQRASRRASSSSSLASPPPAGRRRRSPAAATISDANAE